MIEPAAPQPAVASPPREYDVECVLAVPFDIDLDLDRSRLRERFKEPEPIGLGLGERSPALVERASRLSLSLGAEPLAEDGVGEILAYDFGVGQALVRFRVRATLDRLARIAGNAERVRVDGRTIWDRFDLYGEPLRQKLLACASGEYDARLREDEAYPIFLIRDEAGIGEADAFCRANEQAILGIVGGEDQWARLSEYALRESRLLNRGYYREDLVVHQASGALYYSRDEDRRILGLTLLVYAQYWALKAYNHLLNRRQEETQRILALSGGPTMAPIRAVILELFRGSSERIALLSTLAAGIDVPKVTDDWHLNEVYDDLRDSFGIEALSGVVRGKLAEIDRAHELCYQILDSKRSYRIELWMMVVVVLETLLLFVWFLVEFGPAPIRR